MSFRLGFEQGLNQAKQQQAIQAQEQAAQAQEQQMQTNARKSIVQGSPSRRTS